MPIGRLRMVRDYNRGLPWPIRTAHALIAIVITPFIPLWRWSAPESRRWWARPLVLGLILTVGLFPLDGWLSDLLSRLRLGGDVKRTMTWFGEYGQGGAAILLVLLVCILDPANRRRLLDYLMAAALTGLAVLAVKVMVGRPRPRPSLLEFYDHMTFFGPFGAHPFGPNDGVRHSWELWSDAASDLWSLPSSHTAHAVVMTVWIATVYPRLRTLAVVLASIVGFSRVLFAAHYPTDVIAGVFVGLVVARPCVHHLWGVRFVDWAWQVLVNPDDPPAALRYRIVPAPAPAQTPDWHTDTPNPLPATSHLPAMPSQPAPPPSRDTPLETPLTPPDGSAERKPAAAGLN